MDNRCEDEQRIAIPNSNESAREIFQQGKAYYDGKGVPKDEHKAFLCFEAVANSDYDDGTAILECADCYDKGIGVDREPIAAFKYYLQAANMGLARGQYCVGSCYYDGAGIEQDYVLAVDWFKKAAEQGYSDAEYNIGVCYEYGTGVEQSDEMAAYWYQKAAEKDHSSAQLNLGLLYKYGRGCYQEFRKIV